MKRALISAVIGLLLLTVLPAQTPAQNRQRTTAPKRSTQRSSSTRAGASSSDARMAAAGRVAEQIKVLTRFLYLLGGVAKGIETAEVAARAGDLTPAQAEQVERSKATVKQSLRNVREGLDKLEIEFSETTELKLYYRRLAGVAAGAATAEDQAAANQFDQAGRSLLAVVNRLTDVLLEMR